MKPAALLELAEQVGVSFCLGSAGTIKAKGEAEQIGRLALLIREHKAYLLAYLQSGSGRGLAATNQSCSRLNYLTP